ncbi:hypothetical protein CEXT_445951 [Caerostris extrusa]|uniref:Uncharacterized protein n=1 Tax=Caerostris extrusa TaxID=172846 RepID=A0AAV4USE6_CAEEX|nr:hypothetical protein CEXT_445951 [Caerostris extrusa]
MQIKKDASFYYNEAAQQDIFQADFPIYSTGWLAISPSGLNSANISQFGDILATHKSVYTLFLPELRNSTLTRERKKIDYSNTVLRDEMSDAVCLRQRPETSWVSAEREDLNTFLVGSGYNWAR